MWMTMAIVVIWRGDTGFALVYNTHTMMRRAVQRQLDRLHDLENWSMSRRVLLRELRREPGDHWLLTQIGSTFYEERDYHEALKWSKRALRVMPTCPLVLWNHACVLDSIGNQEEAIMIWKRLLGSGVQKIAYGDCGEGLRWAESLLNDCRFRIAVALHGKGKIGSAVRYYATHLSTRRRGLPSLYTKREVLRGYQKALSSLHR